MTTPHLSILQRIQLRLLGRVRIGSVMKHGWSERLPWYIFRCEKHGIVANYPQGYESRLDCPKCQEERASKAALKGRVSDPTQPQSSASPIGVLGSGHKDLPTSQNKRNLSQKPKISKEEA